MSDDTGLVEALLGLEGFVVLEVAETEAEVTIRIETTASVVACDGCGVRADAKDRMVVQYRDLALRDRGRALRGQRVHPLGGRPVRAGPSRTGAFQLGGWSAVRPGSDLVRRFGIHHPHPDDPG